MISAPEELTLLEALHAQSPHPVTLDKQFLFCKRYLDDVILARCAGLPINLTSDSDVLKKLSTVQNQLGSGLVGKRGIQSVLESALCLDAPRMTSETFMSLFQLPGWMEMWTPAEFGWWFSIGLSQYGLESAVEELIDKTYETKRDALMWLFLGAHDWLHLSYPHCYAEHQTRGCCRGTPHGREKEYLTPMIESISQDDRVWIVEQLVRRAPEFGVCRDLGVNIYNYKFIMQKGREDKEVFGIFAKEIASSRMRPLFEYSIRLSLDL
jgi:hypothetical protein